MRLLVTGFGPFPTMPRNPSAALAAAVATSPRWRLYGVAVERRTLTTAYAALRRELDPALDQRPDAVLMIGVAGRSKPVRVERRATDRKSTLFADASGTIPTAAGSNKGPRERRSRVASTKVLRALRRHRVPSRISHDAGRYLCNAAYYRALARPCPVLFIHIPKARERVRPCRAASVGRQQGRARLVPALVEIGLDMLRQARGVVRPKRVG